MKRKAIVNLESTKKELRWLINIICNLDIIEDTVQTRTNHYLINLKGILISFKLIDYILQVTLINYFIFIEKKK